MAYNGEGGRTKAEPTVNVETSIHVDVKHDQKVAWVMRGKHPLASFAFEDWGGAVGAQQAAYRFMDRDDARDALEAFAEVARHHAADAPEWNDEDTVSVILRIGDLRTVLDAVADHPTPEDAQ